MLQAKLELDSNNKTVLKPTFWKAKMAVENIVKLQLNEV